MINSEDIKEHFFTKCSVDCCTDIINLSMNDDEAKNLLKEVKEMIDNDEPIELGFMVMNIE